jgi:hypothetical protein
MVPVWCCVSVVPSICAVAVMAHVVWWLPFGRTPIQHTPPVAIPVAVAALPCTANVMLPAGWLPSTPQSMRTPASPDAVTVIVPVRGSLGIDSPLTSAVPDHVAWNVPSNAAAEEPADAVSLDAEPVDPVEEAVGEGSPSGEAPPHPLAKARATTANEAAKSERALVRECMGPRYRKARARSEIAKGLGNRGRDRVAQRVAQRSPVSTQRLAWGPLSAI